MTRLLSPLPITIGLFLLHALNRGAVATYYCMSMENCEMGKCPYKIESCDETRTNRQVPFNPDASECSLTYQWNSASNRRTVVAAGCAQNHGPCPSICTPKCGSHVNGFVYCTCCCNDDLCNKQNVTNYVIRTDPPSKPSSKTLSDFVTPSVSTSSSTTTTSSSGSEVRRIVIAIGATVGCVVFFAAVFVLSFYFWNRCYRDDHMDSECGGTVELDSQNANKGNCFLNEDLMELASGFDFGAVSKEKHIGIGRFAHVWRVRCHDDVYAAKIFSEADAKSWNTEVDAYVRPPIKHENVLHFVAALGWEKENDDNDDDLRVKRIDYWLVTEYHEMGSLMDFLKNNLISFGELCGLARSIAQGLAYLHTEMPMDGGVIKPAIAHRDMKSRNILMKSHMSCCISDMGLAMKFQPGTSLVEAQGQVGTIRYMAPEVLEGAISFTRESFLRIDIYAMALILWELVSRCDLSGSGNIGAYKQPFEEEVGSHPGFEEMKSCVVKLRMRPQFPTNQGTVYPMEAFEEMIEECWDSEGEARLTAQCVSERISQLEFLEKSSGYVSMHPDTASSGSSPTSVPGDSNETPATPPASAAAPENDELGNLRAGSRHVIKPYFPPDRSASPPPYTFEDPFSQASPMKTLVPLPVKKPKNIREDSYTETSL